MATTAKTTRTARERFLDPQLPDLGKLSDAALASEAAEQLREMVELLERVAAIADEWGDTHGVACRCALCKFAVAYDLARDHEGFGPSWGDDIESLADDMPGIAWQVRNLANYVESLGVGRRHPRPAE